MHKRLSGFTIVELLIVIVLIAVLAAISIVAYNGIQNRTQNTKTVQAMGQYVKIFHTYATTYGVYPTNVTPPTAPPANLWSCLPYNVTSCGSSTNTPSSCFGLNPTNTSNVLDAELKKVAAVLPSVSDKQIECSSTQTFQGALVLISNSGKSVQFNFVQSGDVACPTVGGTTQVSRIFSTNATRCQVAMPDLV